MNPRGLFVTLVLLGGLLTACLGAIAASGNLVLAPWRFVLFFLIALLSWGAASWLTFTYGSHHRRVLWVVFGGAIVFRLILLPVAPSLSTDLYRYLWEGKVQQAGINPYRFAPNAPELASLRDSTISPFINHPDWIIVYPPGAELLFRGMAWWAPGSVLAMKGLFVLLDLVSCGLIVLLLRRHGMDPAWVILYAWHPLVLVELAGSGHLDAVVIPLIVGGLVLAQQGRITAAGLLLGIGGSMKLYPLLLLPAVSGRRPWRPLLAATAVMGAGYLVFLPGPVSPLGSIERWMREEWFNPGIRFGLEQAFQALGMDPGSLVRWGLLAVLGLVGVGVWLAGSSLSLERRALWMMGAHLFLIPNLFPWYVVSIVPLLCLTPMWPWLWLSGAVGLSYLFFAQAPWSIPLWVTLVEFVPLWAGLLLFWSRAWGWARALWAIPVRRKEA